MGFAHVNERNIPAASGEFCAYYQKMHFYFGVLRSLIKCLYHYRRFTSASPIFVCLRRILRISPKDAAPPPPPHRGAMFPTVISPLEVPERRRFGAGKHRKEAPYFQFLKSRLVPFQIICTRKTRHQSICLDESYRVVPSTRESENPCCSR